MTLRLVTDADTAASDGDVNAIDDGYEWDEEQYEKAVEELRTKNDAYLDEFEAALRESGLKTQTINRHLNNVDFYINNYLLRSEPWDIEQGCYCVDDFLGYFFIRKCMWSTPATIRQNAASFKKFYKCMREAGHVSEQAYNELLATIKDMLPTWVDACEQFNNPSISPFGDEFDTDLFNAAYDTVARMLGLDQLGLQEQTNAEDEGYLVTRDEAIAMLTIMLFYLTSWKEKDPLGNGTVRRAWKSADWGALDYLRDGGFIVCSNKAKSVTLTEDGEACAIDCLEATGLGYLVE